MVPHHGRDASAIARQRQGNGVVDDRNLRAGPPNRRQSTGMRGCCRTIASGIALLLAACAPAPADRDWLDAPTTLASPAGAGSRFPHLATPGAGGPVMSWLEPAAASMSLRYSRWAGQGWGPPSTVASGADWFVNWADFPSVVTDGEGHWGAHWLQKVPGGTYAYGVRIATSDDDGATWSAPQVPHGDGTATEHGFVSLLPWRGALLALWLDGRNTGGDDGHDHGGGGAMTVRSAVVDYDGTMSGPDTEIDARTCDCCQTGLALAGSVAVAVFRDRGEDGTRDISIVRLEDGRWSAPVPVARDGWRIDACPVNGPAVDARGDTVVVAWFTGAGGARVRLAWSADAGRSFAAPIDVDHGRVAGRVDVVLLRDGRAVVTWLRGNDRAAALLARPYTAAGPAGRAVEITGADASRAGGFPQVALAGDDLVFAWTESGPQPQVQSGVARLR